MAHPSASSGRAMRRRGQSGQAMIEYSTSTVVLFVVGGFMGMQQFLPLFLTAYDRYLKGIYLMLNLALP